jgi:putative nucleotidyltransferase with HDIG domain
MIRIAEIIQSDPLMVARILHIAHSSFYNIPAGVTNLLQALNFLGMDIIKTLVLYVKIFSLKEVSNETQVMLKEVKTHSMNVAKYAKVIMEKETKDKKLIELAYIAGLLHDIGKIVLLQFNEKMKSPEYAKNIHSFSSFDFENDQYGISHVKVGIYILKLWGFQDEIIESVAHHHDPNILSGKALSIKETLFIANAFSYEQNDLSANISEHYGAEKFDQWDRLFNDDIRPALDLPL